MIWFTADHHFSHKNVIKYNKRPFSSVEEMDAVMIERWNKVVKPEDTTYHLGDFTLGDYKMFENHIEKLNGHIKIIPGGHDFRWSNATCEHYNIEILQPLYSLSLSTGKRYPLVIVLCHYAMRVWDRSHFGSLHLYGHSHGNLAGHGKSMDVGVDTNNFYPYSLEEIVEKLSRLESIEQPHRRKEADEN